MGAVVEAAGEGDVGYRPVSGFWGAQQVLGAIQALDEHPLHHGFPMLSKDPMQKACGDAEFARQGLRRETRIAVAEVDEAACADEKRFPPSLGRLRYLRPRFAQ